MTHLTVHSLRGETLESEHPISAVLVSPDGHVVERIGEPMVTTMRSAAKPFQLDVSLGLLPPKVQASFSEQELALGASSHAGQPRHISLVRELLARFDLDVHHVYCGAHWPGHVEAGRQMLRDGVQLTQLHNNCSGKHTFMAAAAAAHGWNADYRGLDHPIQQRIRASMDRLTGGRIRRAVVDGCGVPCWVASLRCFAMAWAQLASAMADARDHLKGHTEGMNARLGRIGWAMQRQPWYVSGDDRIDGTVMTHATRPLVAKVGAQALLCLAMPEEELGIAIKVRTGNDDARAVAVGALLERWSPGRLPSECLDRWRVVRNVVGKPVGRHAISWS